nr:MAG TPA: hypothetical protein [Caudoviricetes sp.]
MSAIVILSYHKPPIISSCATPSKSLNFYEQLSII